MLPAKATCRNRKEILLAKEAQNREYMPLKKTFSKPGNLLYPVPAVLVGCGDGDISNLITVAWAGTVCSDPPMLSIAVRKERFSHGLLTKSGVFTVNLVNEALVRACDFCGCRTGREPFSKDMFGKKLPAPGNKFDACHLTREAGPATGAPMVAESPAVLECCVTQVLELGCHDLFLAMIEAVHVEEELFDRDGALHLEDAYLIAYSHGKYQSLGEVLGTFGYSVRRK